jgi:hypothetical protein
MADQPTNGNAWAAGHPKVSASIFGGALASLIIGTLKARYGLDLAGQETNLMIVVMGAVGYMAPGST